MKKLDKNDLLNNTLIKIPKFKNTSELKFKEKLIGQDKGIQAIEFGLKVKDSGYNIYIAGDMGTGKTTSAKILAEEISKNEVAPPDFIYVFNFDNAKNPILIELPTKLGNKISNDLDKIIEKLVVEIPKTINDEKLVITKSNLLNDFELNKEVLFKQLANDILEDNFVLKHSSNGIYIMPILDGEVVSEEDYDKLPDDIKESLRELSLKANRKVELALDKIKNDERDIVKTIDDIESSKTSKLIEKHFKKFVKDYSKYEIKKLDEFIKNIQKDILENLHEFLPVEQSSEEASLQDLLAMPLKTSENSFLNKYKINVFVDNSSAKNAKVVVVENPTYTSLFGEIECESEGNAISTDFTKIRSGALHEAYGGYVIISCYDLLSNAGCYEKLRSILKTRKITVDSETQVNNAISYSLIKPEYMEFNSKIILVGNVDNYYNISSFDDDFRKYFKVFSSFDYEMDCNEKNCLDIVNFIQGFVKKHDGLHFTYDAVLEILRYSQRLSGSNITLNTNFNLLSELLTETTLYGRAKGETLISVSSVKEAIAGRNNRSNHYEEKMVKMIDDELIMIDTKGDSVGQINGLCVISSYDYSFGMPTRITATTYIGTEGVVNIEKEADMSGNIHEKGVGVLSGYLGSKYSQDFPLCLSSRICFEQNYNGVDGDSASSTELYAILSSLSEVPIKQSIAVTGSINQKGYIQPIGGVTEKVEGYFKLCKKRGLTGDEAVIIPKQNVNDLVLNAEVIEAVDKGLFSIYSIATIDEGMEILTGKKMGNLIDGEYEKDSINYLVYEKLKKYYEKRLK